VTRALAIAALAAGCVALPYTGGARPADAVLDASWLRAAPTPAIRQAHESDCGLAALAMIAGAWGQAWPLDQLERELPPGPHGTRLAALRDLARRRGLDAHAIRATAADLRHELAAGRPVVLGLVLPHERETRLAHYEVAIAMSTRDGSVITIDPATGRRLRRSPSTLDAEWQPAGYPALVVTAGTRDARN